MTLGFVTLDFATRTVLDFGYLAVFLMGLRGAIRFTDPARRTQAIGWAVAASVWLWFYTFGTLGLAGLSDELITTALWSRLFHVPMIGLGVGSLIIANDRERELRLIWQKIGGHLEESADAD